MDFGKIFLSVFLFFLSWQAHAQISSLKKFSGTLTSDTIVLDSFTIMPSTVCVLSEGDTIKTYKLDNNTIIFDSTTLALFYQKNVQISFQTFDNNFENPVTLIDIDKIKNNIGPYPSTYEYNVRKKRTVGIIDSKELNYSGSFSRSFSVGNAQSLVVNSNFDMQLQGDLGNGLKIIAAISDANLPIQAQGNTQQLQEFDKVFIQVSKSKTSLIAGDYELSRPPSYFSNYYKKVQGIQLNQSIDISKNSKLTASGGFAISRGKFARQTLPTKEGNQGPYRLVGNNGERYIIVLSGTEKIYFNGKLLTRGYDNDYIINYNNAEVIFSPSRLVARDSRVIIEFEYTDISYLRSLYTLQSNFESKKWQAGISFYNEQDSKNAIGDISLDSMDIALMKASGDDLNKQVRYSIRSIKPDDLTSQTAIFYYGLTNPVDPSVPILVFTTQVDSAQYIANFTEVGQGKGDYIIDKTLNVNGRVYKYVGKNAGAYLPIVKLIPPEKKQLITYYARYSPKKDITLGGEVAMSVYDKNRFSVVDAGDDQGTAAILNYRHGLSLKKEWKLALSANYEFAQKSFNPLNPYRPAEFVRDWNVQNLLDFKGNEHIFIASLAASLGKNILLQVDQNQYVKGQFFTGKKQQLKLEYRTSRITSNALVSLLNGEDKIHGIHTSFLRPSAGIKIHVLKADKLSIGTAWEGETNASAYTQNDSMSNTSLSFSSTSFYLSSRWNTKWESKVSYTERKDKLPLLGALIPASNAQEWTISGTWQPSDRKQLDWHFTDRNFILQNEQVLQGEKSKRTLLGKLGFQWLSKEKVFKVTTNYNAGSGQEPKLEYVFKQVENGLGEYVYIGESSIPNQQNIQDYRYDPSNPLAAYIRFTIPNNEFVRTNNIELNQNFSADFSKKFKPKEGVKMTGFQKLATRFSTLSNVQLSKRQQASVAHASIGSYLDFSLKDTTLVAFTSNQLHTLFYNRGHVGFDAQISYRERRTKLVQISGADLNGIREWTSRCRYGIAPGYDVLLTAEKGTKSYNSEAFDTRNYEIKYINIKPEISLRPTGRTKIGASYAWSDKKQTILNHEKAMIHNFTGDASWRVVQKWTLDASASLVKISFDGMKNSVLEYDMLDGLKNGNNYLWSIRFTKRMSNNVDLTIQYDGRKPGENPSLHTGRAQAKATF